VAERTATPRASTREAFANAAGPIALRGRTLALFSIPSFAAVVLGNQVRLGGTPLQWLTLALIGYLVTIAILMVFRATVLPAYNRGPRAGWTNFAFMVSGGIRGYVVWLVGGSWGLIPANDLLFRLTGGYLLVLGGLASMTIYEAARIKHEDALIELGNEKANLDELRGGIRQRIAALQDELTMKVQAILMPIVFQLQNDLKTKGSKEAAQNILAAADDLVRPLSHEVGLQAAVIENSTPSTSNNYPRRRTRSSWPQRVALGAMVVPMLVVFAILTTTLGSLGFAVPQAPVSAQIIFVGLGWFLYRTWQRVFADVWLPVWLAFLVTLTSGLLVAATTWLVFQSLGWNVEVGLWGQYSSLLVFVSMLIFYMQLNRTQRAAAEQQLREVVDELAITNAQLRQEVWVNRRRVAAVIHGPIQAALYASAMRLAKAQEPTAELIASVTKDVSEALAKLEAVESSETLDSVVEQMQEVWGGVLEISMGELTPEVKASLEANPTATNCVLEVIREGVGNAARHGAAKNAAISIACNGKDLLEVLVTNDGQPIAGEAEPGFGSQILDEVAYSWSLTSAENRTILRALVAI
jgi:signal transduction histidine kinase